MTPGCERRAIPRWAGKPTTMYDDVERRASLSRVTADLLDLAGRAVDALLAEAASPALTMDERRGLVGIAIEVDHQAAARVGVPTRMVEIAARGRAALAGEVVS